MSPRIGTGGAWPNGARPLIFALGVPSRSTEPTTMSRPKFDGQRLRANMLAEGKALLARYNQFATLLPAEETEGAAHRGEDGRFVEALLRSFLCDALPSSILVSTGFILRPAVKTGIKGNERRGNKDQHSKQLDIIVFDGSNYPVFQQLGGSVIVPPEGVLAIVSVKKTLRERDIAPERDALCEAAQLCRCLDQENKPLRGPFLALFGATSSLEKKKTAFENVVFSALSKEHRPSTYFDEALGLIAVLDRGSVFKRRPTKAIDVAEYIWFKHAEGEEHLALQLLLTGILSAFYDVGRTTRRRPGYTGFEPGRTHDATLGQLPVAGLRAVRATALPEKRA
jgi:hypothetical protein